MFYFYKISLLFQFIITLKNFMNQVKNTFKLNVHVLLQSHGERHQKDEAANC